MENPAHVMRLTLTQPLMNIKSWVLRQRRPIAPAMFVWLLWVFCVAMLSVSVVRYGVWYPRQDDWYVLDVITGEQRLSLAKLWSQHNDHRIVLPRLVFYVLYALSGADMRSAMLFNVVCLAVVSAGMILVARRIRGRSAYTDAFFSLVSLHQGLGAFQWSFHVQFSLSTTIFSLLLILSLWQTHFSLRSNLVFGFGLFALALCGANGLVLSIGVALILLLGILYVLFVQRAYEVNRLAFSQRIAPMAVISVTTLALAGLYLIDYRFRDASFQQVPLSVMVINTVHLLAAFTGAATFPFGWSLTVPVVVLVLSSVGLVVANFIKTSVHHDHWYRNLRLVALVLALLAAFVLISRARANEWSIDMAGHYSVFSLPIAFISYLAWQVCASRQLARLLQTILFTGACFIYGLYLPAFAEHYRKPLLDAHNKLERLLRLGAPSEFILNQYAMYDPHATSQEIAMMTRRLDLLREQRIGKYQKPYGFDEFVLPVTPTAVYQVEPADTSFDGDVQLWRIMGEDPQFEYSLPSNLPISTVHIKFRYPEISSKLPRVSDSVSFQLFWDTGRGFSEAESTVNTVPLDGEGRGEVVFYVFIEDIRRIRFDTPAYPDSIQIEEVKVSVPLLDSAKRQTSALP